MFYHPVPTYPTPQTACPVIRDLERKTLENELNPTEGETVVCDLLSHEVIGSASVFLYAPQ